MTDNDNLELKKRSRRRLVGAAALALLAAIVLPMVMDQEPGSTAQDIQVAIPDRDADSALARPIAGRLVEPQIAPPPEEQPAVPVESPDPAPAPQRARPDASVPTKGPDTPAASVAAGSPAQIPPAARKDDAARVIALLEDRKPVAGPGGEAFVVQLGAFAEAAKADAIGADLKSRGFAAYTEKSGGVTRVRIGPFRSREDAEKIAERLRLSGLSGVVMPR